MENNDWLKEHKKLAIEYCKLKNKRKEINKQLSEIAKKLNQLDDVLIRG